MSSNNIKISCQNLWKIFGPHPEKVISFCTDGLSKENIFQNTGCVVAVSDVSLEVPEGEVFVIMGLSGSGKSTLLRCINRLVEPTQGEVFIDGEPMSSLSEKKLIQVRRKKLGMVFQHFGLLPHRQVIDNVVYGLEVQGMDKAERAERALRALDLVGLSGWEDSYPDQLSGGMQQRVGLARALVIESDILLMDEPFSALDPLIRRQMQDEFIKLQEVLSKTVIFITHDLIEALKLGKHIAVMKDGQIIQIGTPQDIVTKPADEYVADFVRDVPTGKVLQAGNIVEEPSQLATMDQEPGVVLSTMEAKAVENLFVVDSEHKLKGLVMMADVAEAVHRGETNLNGIIKADPAVTEADRPIEQLIPMAVASDIPIAVVDQQKRLLGVVSRLSLLSHIGTSEVADR